MLTANPVKGYDPRQLLDAQDENERTALMRQMGVANIDGPLPHSPCLKNIRTGVVLPWNELLAQHHDLVVCCDEDGNTDPAKWGPKVIQNNTANDVLTLMAQQQMFVPKADSQYEHYTPSVKQNIGPTEYEKHDAVSYAEIDKLREKLHHENTTTDSGSVERSE